MTIQEARCLNYNHGRLNAPVRFCPMCGKVVNENIPIRACSEQKHVKSRRDQKKYCIDCGKQLIR